MVVSTVVVVVSAVVVAVSAGAVVVLAAVVVSAPWTELSVSLSLSGGLTQKQQGSGFNMECFSV